MNKPEPLKIKTNLIKNGLEISVDGQAYSIKYPQKIWQTLTMNLKNLYRENVAFASTNYIPLLFNKDNVTYDFSTPLLKSEFFENQLYDMIDCALSDNRPVMDYLKKFYNLNYTFSASKISSICEPVRPFKTDKVLTPFTFGKESLVTFALIRELDQTPIAVYSMEPTHPFEDQHKKNMIKQFKNDFGFQVHYIYNSISQFRDYKRKIKDRIVESKLGWGAQTTLLNLLLLPYIFYFKANKIYIGNEFSNNEVSYVEGLKTSSAGYDQTSDWTKTQDLMIRSITGGNCRVFSSLEPLEEINIFYILHKRYAYLSKYQFSCRAADPLVKGSNWCHKCYKCQRFYLFAEAIGVDPKKLGFKRNLLNERGLFKNYFDQVHASGSKQELDFCFYILHLKKNRSFYVRKFEKEKLRKLKKFDFYLDFYTKLHPYKNLDPIFEDKIIKIFKEELNNFKNELKKIC